MHKNIFQYVMTHLRRCVQFTHGLQKGLKKPPPEKVEFSDQPGKPTKVDPDLEKLKGHGGNVMASHRTTPQVALGEARFNGRR
jgi:hypothetical protein